MDTMKVIHNTITNATISNRYSHMFEDKKPSEWARLELSYYPTRGIPWAQRP